MSVRSSFELPDEQEAQLKRARRLEWATIFFMLTITAAVGFTLSTSQAMKATWVEDLLSFVPPIAFLIAIKFRRRKPNARFPYGYRRAMSIAFLVASVALFGFGLFILVDSVLALVYAVRPTIGSIEIFGRQVWFGWVMIAVLAYSVIPPVILGRLKQPLAIELHEKVLYTDAEMNKADWMTGLAGIAGIVGIGYGFWWADAVAAGTISLDVVKDGAKNLKHAVTDLMDERPTTVEREEPDSLSDKIKATLEDLAWVKEASVRLREEGDVVTGEAFVVPRDEDDLLARVALAEEAVKDLHWRIYDVIVVPRTDLPQNRHYWK